MAPAVCCTWSNSGSSVPDHGFSIAAHPSAIEGLLQTVRSNSGRLICPESMISAILMIAAASGGDGLQIGQP